MGGEIFTASELCRNCGRFRARLSLPQFFLNGFAQSGTLRTDELFAEFVLGKFAREDRFSFRITEKPLKWPVAARPRPDQLRDRFFSAFHSGRPLF
jgi:hypothetical protein